MDTSVLVDQVTMEVLRAVIILAISFAVMFVVKYVIPMINEKVDVIQDERLKAFIREAVQCAEQTLKTGAEKKEFVANLIIEWLKTRSRKSEEKEIDALIESAVYDMNEAVKQNSADK